MVKKKPSHPPHEEHADETWLVPYSDLLTLLLALFIVLFASSSLDKDKAAQIQYALAAAFGSGVTEDTEGNIINFMNDARDLNLEDEGVIISSDANGATLEMTSINLFDKGSVILKAEAIPVIKKISYLLNSNKYKKYRIVVEGHTDDTNESETLPSNWELSGARAGAVTREMISNSMDVNRFKAVGLAEISPAYPNKNPYGEPIPENRLKNRRVMIRIEF
ncbi:MAG: flagellar motor protein MotB [Kiritimatiellae bacterium]|nr:hypothetical protein [Alphaproteobacteria bacterium]MBQ8570956.1 flagellar motor protein MotB [Kiritimatiellia bacterium]